MDPGRTCSRGSTTNTNTDLTFTFFLIPGILFIASDCISAFNDTDLPDDRDYDRDDDTGADKYDDEDDDPTEIYDNEPTKAFLVNIETRVFFCGTVTASSVMFIVRGMFVVFVIGRPICEGCRKQSQKQPISGPVTSPPRQTYTTVAET